MLWSVQFVAADHSLTLGAILKLKTQ